MVIDGTILFEIYFLYISTQYVYFSVLKEQLFVRFWSIVLICSCKGSQRNRQFGKMINDLYVNARSNILLIAFKITIILGAHVGWEWELGGFDAESKAGPYSLGHINQ